MTGRHGIPCWRGSQCCTTSWAVLMGAGAAFGDVHAQTDTDVAATSNALTGGLGDRNSKTASATPTQSSAPTPSSTPVATPTSSSADQLIDAAQPSTALALLGTLDVKGRGPEDRV